MARQPRVEYAGAAYHVMNRGDRGGRVFLDNLDYELFIAGMGEVCRRTGWQVHAFALLPNHFHWLVETPEANLVAGMKWFLGAYSQGFNGRHGRRGHVFQGRYKASPIQTDSGNYFEIVSAYIHLNPARAGLVSGEPPDLKMYPWSSYPQYLAGKQRKLAWVDVKRVLGNMGLEDDTAGLRSYAEYMDGRLRELTTRSGKRLCKDEWRPIRYGWCLGDEQFKAEMIEKVGSRMAGKKRESYGGRARQEHDERAAERLVGKGLKALGMKEAEFLGERKGSLAKCALAWYVHANAMVSHEWISNRLQMGSPLGMSLYLARMKNASDGEALVLRGKLEQA